MDNNKHQADKKSLTSINEKISFFEEQKNRIRDSLPASSRVKMADMEEDKLKSIPEVEENALLKTNVKRLTRYIFIKMIMAVLVLKSQNVAMLLMSLALRAMKIRELILAINLSELG